MNARDWIILLLGAAMLLAALVAPSWFQLGGNHILLYFIISIPTLAKYLRKAKLFGAEFDFAQAIEEARAVVAKVIGKVPKSAKSATNSGSTLLNLAKIRPLLEQDPALALAALRLEIETKLKWASSRLGLTTTARSAGVNRYLDALRDSGEITNAQAEALRHIVTICNKAIHGEMISYHDAFEVLEIADSLNKTFAVGYSLDFTPNSSFREQGLLCEWEHCIEHMPLAEEPTDRSCQVFGHDCPGGSVRRSTCQMTIHDIPSNRFGDDDGKGSTKR